MNAARIVVGFQQFSRGLPLRSPSNASVSRLGDGHSTGFAKDDSHCFTSLDAPAPPAQHHRQCGALVFNLEAISESHIRIGEGSAMLIARHQLAGEEVTNTDIRDERLVEDVLR